MAIQLDPSMFDKENIAVVLHGKEDLRLEKWPLPQKLEDNGKCGWPSRACWFHGIPSDHLVIFFLS